MIASKGSQRSFAYNAQEHFGLRLRQVDPTELTSAAAGDSMKSAIHNRTNQSGLRQAIPQRVVIPYQGILQRSGTGIDPCTPSCDAYDPASGDGLVDERNRSKKKPEFVEYDDM